ncbi:hypothetical protein L1987_50056 [Smallanthus sonchifolius]|uniref:Uncharacterized protein n=1 Tax=Smallanthus sonchifolius TaxID=185202 RepID=A0ACB9FVR7_9ASTR|nr:hypothetical protein L1987_50056 [Smallanthus sonchifolius]
MGQAHVARGVRKGIFKRLLKQAISLIRIHIIKGLVSICDQRARMMQDQFSVCVSCSCSCCFGFPFHDYKNPLVIDQCDNFWSCIG